MKSGSFGALAPRLDVAKTLALTFLLFFSFHAVHAQTVADTAKSQVASVSYVGIADNQLCFSVNYDAGHVSWLKLAITDEEGLVLFNERFNAASINKVFKTPVESGKLLFAITDLKTGETKKFLVSRESHVHESFAVNKKS